MAKPILPWEKTRALARELKGFLSGPRFDPASPPPRDEGWPRITIVTPSFNQAPFLERAILSVHNQGYPNLEHIILDGGSTDGSREVIRRHARRLAFWRSERDGGQGPAINEGADRSTGTWMTWINSDDLLFPGALLRMGRFLRKNPGTDLVYGDQVEVDTEDRVTKRLFTMDFDLDDFLWEMNIVVHQQSALWKVSLFRDIGGLTPPAFAMDYEMVYRMRKRGARFARLDGFFSAFRVYPQSLTGSGAVARGRDPQLDGVFRDHTGRERNAFDRAVLRPFFKARRLLTHPRMLEGVLEHRLREFLKLHPPE